MTQAQLLIAFFCFVVAAVSAVGYVFVLRPARASGGAEAPAPVVRTQGDMPTAQAAMVGIFRLIGEAVPGTTSQSGTLQRQLIAAGFRTAPYRSTDGTVFVVIEGKGHSKVGDSSFDWAENDVFVAPSWMLQHHRAESEAVLFSFSDRAAQEKLGIWRERRDASAS